MKAHLIDPDTGIIETLNRDFEDFREIQKAIECDCFCTAGMIDGNVVFVDDEGFLKVNLMFTKMDHYPQPLAGKILVVGTTPDGGSKDVTMSAEDLSKQVSFLSGSQVRRMYG